MSYKTVEVKLENGYITAQDNEPLPERATALLTILELNETPTPKPTGSGEPGLARFLSSPLTFTLTEKQFRASMDKEWSEEPSRRDSV